MQTRRREAAVISPPVLEAYIRRYTPTYLLEGGPPPATWTDRPETWDEVARVARAYHRAQLTADFTEAVNNGWTFREIEGGALDRDAHVDADGRVTRPIPPTITSELSERAQEVLRDCHALHVALEGPIVSTVESVAYGSWRGAPRTAEAAVHTAEVSVRGRRAEIAREAEKQAEDRVIIDVSHPFRGPAGKQYARGEQIVSVAEAEALSGWREVLEIERDRRGWDAPEGFTPDIWPPFTIMN